MCATVSACFTYLLTYRARVLLFSPQWFYTWRVLQGIMGCRVARSKRWLDLEGVLGVKVALYTVRAVYRI